MKQFFIKKKILANSLKEALDKEMDAELEECYINNDYKESEINSNQMGFKLDNDKN